MRPHYSREKGLGAVLLVLLTLVAYLPVWRGEFVWDDLLLVSKNPLVTGKLGLGSIWFQTDFPLTHVVLWLQWLLWGGHPAGYHVVNVLLHGLNAVLVWRLAARFMPRDGLAPWLAGALFALHPVCVASVAWISEVKNTLSLAFYLAGALWFLRSEEAGRGSGVQDPAEGAHRSLASVGRYYWLSLGAFLLALLSKTSTVMLPVVLLLCVWWERTGRGSRDEGRGNEAADPSSGGAGTRPSTLDHQLFLRLAPFFALALAFGLMTVWFQRHQAMAGESAASFVGRFAQAGLALWFYLGKTLLPVKLSLIYPGWNIQAATPLAYVPLLLWCGGLALCWVYRRSWGRHALLGLGWFTINLFPVLGFFDMYYFALAPVGDQFEYLPLIGIAGLVAGALQALPAPGVRRLTGPALATALSVLTVQRAGVFAKDETLWRDTLAKNPAAWSAHDNLGCILAEQGSLGAAMAEFRKSLELNRRSAAAHCNLGRALALEGEFAEAGRHFVAALQEKPSDAEIRRTYATALEEEGKPVEAMKQLRVALQLEPDVPTRVQLAALLYQTGQYGEAAAQYRQVLGRAPGTLEALNNLAWLLATCPEAPVRNGTKAVELAQAAERVSDGTNVAVLGTLAAAYAEAGRFSNAVATAEKAIGLARFTSNTNSAAVQESLLELYRTGRAYHEPPGGGGLARPN